MQARLGQHVKLTIETDGRIRRANSGRLKPGLDGRTELVPEDDGALVFKVGRQMAWSRFDPAVFTGAQEQPDHRLLRVGMGDMSFWIETMEPAHLHRDDPVSHSEAPASSNA
jgi:hypothetical protein